MLFNSMRFLVFFPCVVAAYFLLPQKLRWLWLLGCSYVFYMGWNAKYALLMALSTVLTYLCGLGLARLPAGEANRGRRRLLLAACLAANLGILFFFKYFNFAAGSIAALAGALGLSFTAPALQVLLPVGISFYTFQAIGYTIDVYRGDIPAEKNLLRYALFVSFFPQLVAGPIERSRNILPQLAAPHTFNFERCVSGLLVMLWGYFQKMVIADRLAPFVSGAFDSWQTAGKGTLLAGAVFFSVQIYCDFASYSNIAIGTARILGVELMRNFDAPFLARSVRDFWRRWHISLSTWFRDYVYFPLGGSRHGMARACLATMAVFLLSGLWHGANWTFVLWGFLHGVFLCVGMLTRQKRQAALRRLGVGEDAWYLRLGQTLFTFALACGAFVIFRADNVHIALGYLGRLFTAPWASPGFFALGMDVPDFVVSLLAIALLAGVDIASRRGSPAARLEKAKPPLRWAVSLAGIAAILVFGIYGEGFVEAPFIYFQF